MVDGGGVASPCVALTEAQEGLWYAQRLDPRNPLFNTGHYLDLRGPLDAGAFHEAVNGMVAEADSLAFRIAYGPADVTQRDDPALPPGWKSSISRMRRTRSPRHARRWRATWRGRSIPRAGRWRRNGSIASRTCITFGITVRIIWCWMASAPS
jgi:hypothetical protein